MTVADAKALSDEREKSKWSWIGVIFNLCDGDITRTEKVLGKSVIECLLWMSYQKIKNE